MAVVERADFYDSEYLKRERPWESDAPLLEQLLSGRGEGFLYKSDLPTLAQTFIILLKEKQAQGLFSSADTEFVMDNARLMIITFGDEKRRDMKTFSAQHPLRVSIRDLLTPDITPEELGVDLGHENEEDYGMTKQRYLEILYGQRQHPLDRLELTWAGIHALNKNAKGQLTLQDFILQENVKYPQLRILRRKSLDRYDSCGGDASMAGRILEDVPPDPELVLFVHTNLLRSVPKAAIMLPLARGEQQAQAMLTSVVTVGQQYQQRIAQFLPPKRV